MNIKKEIQRNGYIILKNIFSEEELNLCKNDIINYIKNNKTINSAYGITIPDFIKIDERILGRLELDTTDLGSTGGVITGDPINLISPNTSILIDFTEYQGFLDNYKFHNRGDLKFRIVGHTGASPNFTEYSRPL